MSPIRSESLVFIKILISILPFSNANQCSGKFAGQPTKCQFDQLFGLINIQKCHPGYDKTKEQLFLNVGNSCAQSSINGLDCYAACFFRATGILQERKPGDPSNDKNSNIGKSDKSDKKSHPNGQHGRPRTFLTESETGQIVGNHVSLSRVKRGFGFDMPTNVNYGPTPPKDIPQQQSQPHPPIPPKPTETKPISQIVAAKNHAENHNSKPQATNPQTSFQSQPQARPQYPPKQAVPIPEKPKVYQPIHTWHLIKPLDPEQREALLQNKTLGSSNPQKFHKDPPKYNPDIHTREEFEEELAKFEEEKRKFHEEQLIFYENKRKLEEEIRDFDDGDGHFDEDGRYIHPTGNYSMKPQSLNEIEGQGRAFHGGANRFQYQGKINHKDGGGGPNKKWGGPNSNNNKNNMNKGNKRKKVDQDGDSESDSDENELDSAKNDRDKDKPKKSKINRERLNYWIKTLFPGKDGAQSARNIKLGFVKCHRQYAEGLLPSEGSSEKCDTIHQFLDCFVDVLMC